MAEIQQVVEGFSIIHGHKFIDDRGTFRRLLDVDDVRQLYPDFTVAQINYSYSSTKGTVRGMHYQRPPHTETKVVTCLAGAILDVAIDLRPTSDNFGRVFSWELSADGNQCVVVGPGMAHGFQTLSPDSIIHYAVDHEYAPEHESGISATADPLRSRWPLTPTNLSTRDLQLLDFNQYAGAPDFK